MDNTPYECAGAQAEGSRHAQPPGTHGRRRLRVLNTLIRNDLSQMFAGVGGLHFVDAHGLMALHDDKHFRKAEGNRIWIDGRRYNNRPPQSLVHRDSRLSNVPARGSTSPPCSSASALLSAERSEEEGRPSEAALVQCPWLQQWTSIVTWLSRARSASRLL